MHTCYSSSFSRLLRGSVFVHPSEISDRITIILLSAREPWRRASVSVQNGPVLRESKDKETSILHDFMLNWETHTVVLGAFTILCYQRRCRQTSMLGVTHKEQQRKGEQHTENFKMLRPPNSLCFPLSLSSLSALPLSFLSKVFDLSERFDLGESEFCKHIFHDHIATGKGSMRHRGRGRRGSDGGEREGETDV